MPSAIQINNINNKKYYFASQHAIFPLLGKLITLVQRHQASA